MGVDTKFYTDTSNQAEDIMQALKTIGACNITASPTSAPYFTQIRFNYKDENRMLNFFAGTTSYMGMATNMMSLSAHGQAVEIMTRLAKMFGGILQESDCDNKVEMFDKPGEGNLRWLLDQYYINNENTPNNSKEDLEAFVKFCKES